MIAFLKIVMIISILMILVSNYKSNIFQRSIIFLASCGYAFPGTILAVGIVVFIGWLNDNIYFHFSYFTGGFIVLIVLEYLGLNNCSYV